MFRRKENSVEQGLKLVRFYFSLKFYILLLSCFRRQDGFPDQIPSQKIEKLRRIWILGLQWYNWLEKATGTRNKNIGSLEVNDNFLCCLIFRFTNVSDFSPLVDNDNLLPGTHYNYYVYAYYKG